MTTPTPETAQVRSLLEQGVSVRETAKETGLSKGRIEAIRKELTIERRVLGLDPLPGAPMGRPKLVDLEVKVSQDLADELERKARAVGLDRRAYVLLLLERAEALDSSR